MAVEAFIFSVYNSVTGAPITGAAGSMSFTTYKDDLGTNLSAPAITEVGGGLYKFVPTFTLGRIICFILNTGNNPTYLAGSIRPEDFSAWSFAPSPAAFVFAVYDAVTGAPKAGVVNSFTTYVDQNDVSLTQPTITEIGGGLYKFIPSFALANEISFIMSTASNNPIFLSGYMRVEDFSQTGFTAQSLVVTPGQIIVQFAAGYTLDALSAFVSNPANWSISGSPAVTITGVVLSANTIILATSIQSNGASYTLNLPVGITANGGTFSLLGPFAIGFLGTTGDPALNQARSIDERTMDLFFAFPPSVSRALDLTQYSITPALGISSIQQMGPNWYRFTTSNQTIGQTYTVTWPLH